ncbi:hypothetical protein ACQKNX_13085 [Lysinibacillus sp. NPDC093712]|uniref:hypothetical protein n=1 Tax=Lysinibacillus sp. NPDC093712 TaxID=3390579 RepID=UPI003CFCE4EE
MIESILKLDLNVLIAVPSYDEIWTTDNKVSLISIVLEAMGQAAEILWRLNGFKGKAYLAMIDKVEIDSLDLLPREDVKIKAQILSSFGNFKKSKIFYEYKEKKILSIETTHFFNLI